MVGDSNYVNFTAHMGEFLTPARSANGAGPNKEVQAHKSSGKTAKVSQGRLPQVGGSKASHHMDTFRGQKEAWELSGKRKKQGGFLEEERDGGKRNKCNVEELKY